MAGLFISTFLAMLASVLLSYYVSFTSCKLKSKKFVVFLRTIFICFILTCFTIIPKIFYDYMSSNIRPYEGYYVETYLSSDTIWTIAICEIRYNVIMNEIDFNGESYRNGKHIGHWHAKGVIFSDNDLGYLYDGTSESHNDRTPDRNGVGNIHFSSKNEGSGDFRAYMDTTPRKMNLYKIRSEKSISLLKTSKEKYVREISKKVEMIGNDPAYYVRTKGKSKNDIEYEKLEMAIKDFL